MLEGWSILFEQSHEKPNNLVDWLCLPKKTEISLGISSVSDQARIFY